MRSLEALTSYLEQVLGHAPDLSPISKDRLAALPLYLRSRYDFLDARLDQGKIVFALVSESDAADSPSVHAGNLEVLERVLNKPVALVLPGIPSYQRNRLVHQRVPFVVPGSQLFLPMLMMDLRESFQRAPRSSGDTLSASTQALLIFYLLGNPVRDVTLNELADRLGYSAMTLSNASRQLEEFELAKSERQGRSVSVVFPRSRRRTWQKALKLMSSPVKRVVRANWQSSSNPGQKAGTSALAEMTMLDASSCAIWAVPAAEWRADSREIPESDRGNIWLELWKYDPRRLSDGELVDPLSLYLSLRGTGDERIHIALEQILEEFQW